MTVKYGFYDSLNGDRLYTADDINTFLEGVFSDGVFEFVGNGLAVENVPGTMNILVKDGRAYFNKVWIRNTSTLTLPLEPSNLINPRIDIVILEFDSSITVRENSIKILTGIPSFTPVPPVLANTSTLHQYALAHIYVAAGVSEINSVDITNKIGTINTPYAKSLISEPYTGPVTTATNDFQVGNGSGSWIKKTLSETVGILRTILDTIYSSIIHDHSANDITTGTLDYSRLPLPTNTTIGAVKRNTGAIGQYVNGIDSNGNLTYGTPSSPSNILSYIPSWTNVNIGNGTVVAIYTLNGKRCSGNVSLIFGTTTSINFNPGVSVPVPFNSNLIDYTTLGAVGLVDTGISLYMGEAIKTGDFISFRVISASGSYAVWTYVSNTVPHTWNAGDRLTIEFDYLTN